MNLFLIKCGWGKPVGFFFIKLCNVSCCNALPAVRAKQSAVMKGKIDRAFGDSVIVKLDQITLAYFLIFCDETFAVRTAYFQQMAAFDFSAVRVFVDFHTLRS